MNKLFSYKNIIVISLLAALTVAYCALSLMVSDGIGVPVQLQRTLFYDKDAAYENLSEFEIRGDVIYALEGDGNARVNLESGSLGKFKYATVIVSRLSDINAEIAVRYRAKGDQLSDKNETLFKINEGHNTVRIPNDNWEEVELRLGTRIYMSMMIDAVVLSKYPVLPSYFLPLFLFFAAVIAFAWYLIAFRKGSAWLIAHPMAILAVIILLQTVAMAYYINQKRDFFIDENFSYEQANDRQGSSYRAYYDKEWFNQWHGPEYFLSFVSVQPEERFDFAHIYKRFNNPATVHPPFYIMLLHGASSLFPNVFSYWFGGAINLFWMALTTFVLYKAARLLFNPAISYFTCIVWGFSSVAMTYAGFFRMYTTLMFFFTAITYLGLRIVMDKTNLGKRFYAALTGTIVLGLFTQYFFVIYMGFTALFLLVWLLCSKEFIRLRNCVFSMAIGIGAFFLIWPNAIKTITGSRRGQEALGGLADAVNDAASTGEGGRVARIAKERMDYFISSIDKEIFGGTTQILMLVGFVLLLVALMAIFTRKEDSENADSDDFSVGGYYKGIIRYWFPVFYMTCSVALTFLLIIQLTPKIHLVHTPTRYTMPLAPTIVLLFILAIHQLLHFLNEKNKTILIAALSAFVLLSGFANREIHFLYTNRPITKKILSQFENPTLILVNDGENRMNTIRLFDDYLCFDRLFISQSSNSFRKALEQVEPGEELILYIRRIANADAVFENMAKVVSYQGYEYLYRKDFYDAYRIVW